MKYLTPLYLALVRLGLTDVARALYAEHKQSYHPIAQMTLEGILKAA